MYRVTDEQVDYILANLQLQGIETEDLQYNLLDHICCILERELENENDFEKHYHNIIQRFYKKELKELEQETINLLTFKNYYEMKKSMIYSGLISAIAFIVGSLFKIMHWPGAGVLLVLGITVFSLVFLPVLYALKTRESSGQRDKWLLGLGTFVGILYCLSGMFLAMHWPGARIIWFSTLLISFFILIPAYFFTGIRRPETKVNTIITTVLMLGFFGIQFTITAIRPSPETRGKVYTYLQSEQLLQNARQKSVETNNKMVQDMQLVCENLKKFILQQDLGLSGIPEDFEEKGIRVREQNMKQFLSTGEGRKLLTSLTEMVYTYNATAAAKIPVHNTILEPGFLNESFCSSLFVLNNITQLQLSLAQLQQEEAASVALK